MTSRELIKAALEFKEYDRIPISARDVTEPEYYYPNGISSGIYGKKGERKDIWGCGWVALEDGVCGEVKYSPLSDWNKLDSFKPPWDVLNNADLSKVNSSCEQTEKFVCPMWEPAMPNIFERMQHIRGTENLFMDMAYGDNRFFKLRDILQEYYLTQMNKWVNTDIDAIHIADDWGTQKSLLISPVMWKQYYKPMYKQYCDMAHSKGKFVIFHSDGFTEDIIPDLIEIGVDALNLQIFCMNIEDLAHKYHYKVAFWGEIDRQFIQPFGTPQDMIDAVTRLKKAFFKYKYTGYVAQCIYTLNVPDENKEAEWNEWHKER